MLASLYFGWLIAQLNIVIVLVILYALVGVSAVILPLRQKAIFSASKFATKKWYVGRVSILQIVGLVQIVLFSMLTYFGFAFPVLTGPTGSVALATLLIIFIIGVATYVGDLVYYRGKGIDLRLALAAIPPE